MTTEPSYVALRTTDLDAICEHLLDVMAVLGPEAAAGDLRSALLDRSVASVDELLSVADYFADQDFRRNIQE